MESTKLLNEEKVILLKSKNLFPETTLEQVTGCLKYDGEPKSLEEIEDGIRKGMMLEWADCN